MTQTLSSERFSSVIIVLDSFKGSLSSKVGASILADVALRFFSAEKVFPYALADGGEGSLDVLSDYIPAERVSCEVVDPLGRAVTGNYLLTESGEALVELAQASGLHLIVPSPETATRATTFGTGQLIADAISRGARKVSLFLGGSATSDGGVGIAQALGVRFFDLSGSLLPLASEQEIDLNLIHSYSVPESLQEIEFCVVVDVDNPFCGERGAAQTYAPQKGADATTVLRLRDAHENLCRAVEKESGRSFASVPGLGAAGGSSFGMVSFFGASLQRGPKFFLDLIEFESKLTEQSLIVTGEGCIDAQSLEGKLLAEILRRSEPYQSTVLSLCGVVGLKKSEVPARLHPFGLGHLRGKEHPEEALEMLAEQLFALLR